MHLIGRGVGEGVACSRLVVCGPHGAAEGMRNDYATSCSLERFDIAKALGYTSYSGFDIQNR